LRLIFTGVHEDGVGHLVSDYVVEALKLHDPAAVILDFLHFKYRFGNDIGGVVQAFVHRGADGKAAVRPAAIVATGRTAESFMSLLGPSRLLDLCGVRFFADVASAARDLRGRLDSGGQL